MRIAVDALGGDYAPAEVLRGVAQALLTEEFHPKELLVVGPEALVEQSLTK